MLGAVGCSVKAGCHGIQPLPTAMSSVRPAACHLCPSEGEGTAVLWLEWKVLGGGGGWGG